MFAKFTESKMLIVRAVLLLLWAFLIITLFYDPITVDWTRPDNLSSPFRLGLQKAEVQGIEIAEKPYSMAARIFWAMVIPIIPIFLLVFGHEAWRRICPLSFVSQMPRMLGINWLVEVFNRRTGRIDKSPRLVKAESFLQKYFWYIQFGFLSSGVTARLLFTNSDRTMLALFLIGIIVMAFITGIIFGGKTWCNYLCPIAPVQKIYTEPRGLLESNPSVNETGLTQSVCREPGAEADKIACVGCQSPCPDIHLEKQYWDTLFKGGRRLFYYGYLGMVFGFYFYYTVYSGNWNYYFSGAWTHEDDQLDQLLNPGVYINGTAWPIPKILAAPIVMILCIATSYTLGRIVEASYVALRNRLNRPVSAQESRHHIYTLFAFLTFNTFYIFGGRPNLGLLPTIPLWIVDTTIVLTSSIWAFRSIGVSFSAFKKSGMSAGLVRQLKRLKLDFGRILGGRSLENLNPDELMLLAKVLPEFSDSQKQQLYKNVMLDAMNTGEVSAEHSLDFMKEIREQLGISEKDHRKLLKETGFEDAIKSARESRIESLESLNRLTNYQIALEFIIRRYLQRGISLEDAVNDKDLLKEIEKLRNMHSIDDAEHAQVVHILKGEQKIQIEEARRQLDKVSSVCRDIHNLQQYHKKHKSLSLELIINLLTDRRNSRCYAFLRMLSRIGDNEDSLQMASALINCMGGELIRIIQAPDHTSERVWVDSISPRVRATLMTAAPAVEGAETFEQISAEDILQKLFNDKDVIIKAAALYTQLSLNLPQGKANSRLIRSKKVHQENWLVKETAAYFKSSDNPDRTALYKVQMVLRYSESVVQLRNYYRDNLTIGQGQGNDVYVNHHQVASESLALTFNQNEGLLQLIDRSQPLFVNKQQITQSKVSIRPNDEIQLGSLTGGPSLSFDWIPLTALDAENNYRITPVPCLQMMQYLQNSDFFHNLVPEALVDLARNAELREYDEGEYILRAGEESRDIFLLVSGRADVQLEKNGKIRIIDSVPAGQVLGELGIFTKKERSADIITTEKLNRVIRIEGDHFLEVAGLTSSVASNFLKMISFRQQQFLSRVS